MTLRVIVTRPAEQAAAWVHALNDAGIDAVALPLIEIAPPENAAAVDDAWRRLPMRRLVVFVSPNAVERFFARRPAGAAWPPSLRAGSVGPGSTQALQRAGVPAAAIVEPPADAPQFDSHSLWQHLEADDWRGASVLIVRGDGGREWLAQRLRERGAAVDFVAAYHRVPPSLDTSAQQCLHDAVAHPADHLWFFSSTESIDNLLRTRPEVSWAPSRAIATHPRIAQRARDCGFGRVHEVRPSLDAVVACIQSLAS